MAAVRSTTKSSGTCSAKLAAGWASACRCCCRGYTGTSSIHAVLMNAAPYLYMF